MRCSAFLDIAVRETQLKGASQLLKASIQLSLPICSYRLSELRFKRMRRFVASHAAVVDMISSMMLLLAFGLRLASTVNGETVLDPLPLAIKQKIGIWLCLGLGIGWLRLLCSLLYE